LYTLLLLGLGLNIFSMNGPDIPEVKKIIRSTTMEHAKHVARRVMSFDSERQVMPLSGERKRGKDHPRGLFRGVVRASGFRVQFTTRRGLRPLFPY